MKLLRTLLLLLAATAAQGQQPNNYFNPGPAGPVKSNGTFALQQEFAADIEGLWTGCTSTTTQYLRADGTCQVPPGTGVTSVALTMPSWFTITGSPITTAGTLTVTSATGQTANQFLATPNGTTGAVGLRAIVLADLPVGLISTTGSPTSGELASFSGPSSITNGNISGDCTTSNTLAITCTKTSGTAFGTFATQNFATPPTIGGTTPAPASFTTVTVAPTTTATALTVTGVASVTTPTAAINGVTNTGASAGLLISAGTNASDYALKINKAGGISAQTYFEIFGDSHFNWGWSTASGSPFWILQANASGNVTLNPPGSGDALTVDGVASGNGLTVVGSSTSGQSDGEYITAGTTSADYALLIRNQAGSSNYLEVFGDGGTVTGSATGGDKGAGTVNATGVYVNGVAIPATGNYAYGTVTSACAFNQAKNMTCGSHSNGTGIYDLTVTGFSAEPFCIVSADGPAFGQYVSASSTSTTVVVATYNTSSANADEAFSVLCFQ